jgi:hypothetical protein
MDINYHYYTVKTLAAYAGFDAETAQYIAYFSQLVDDYILHSPFTVDTRPPDFFVKNRLARKVKAGKGTDRWAFLPCATGFDVLRTVSAGYRLHTLMPFHFIMPREYKPHENTERSLYRCVSANRGDQLPINQLMRQSLSKASPEDKSSLMALGMLLHTFADTYAHEGFSGFKGWENDSYIHEMRCHLPPHDTMAEVESTVLRALPDIGHAKVGLAPDMCGCQITLFAKRTEKGPLEPFILRDNTVFFADCSRRILDMLCAVNKKTPFDDSRWSGLQNKLAEAQSHRGKNKGENWAGVFPHISYIYQKDEFISIQPEPPRHDKNELLTYTVSDDFYRYNEAAYRHTHAVTGVYVEQSRYAQLAAYLRFRGIARRTP